MIKGSSKAHQFREICFIHWDIRVGVRNSRSDLRMDWAFYRMDSTMTPGGAEGEGRCLLRYAGGTIEIILQGEANHRVNYTQGIPEKLHHPERKVCRGKYEACGCVLDHDCLSGKASDGCPSPPAPCVRVQSVRLQHSMCSHGKFAPKQDIQRNLRCLLGSG